MLRVLPRCRACASAALLRPPPSAAALRRALSGGPGGAAPPPPPPPPPPSSGPQLAFGVDNKTLAVYGLALAVAVGGMSYLAVPLYKVFCQATGYGGTTQKATEEKFKGMRPVEGARALTIYFSADTSAAMPWAFHPQQRSVRVVPGETALAFYTARNPTAEPVTGVSTYNITPMRAAPYFNKIQCFCFEEQRLRPNEEIDMPVFFYVDPDFLKDPAMANIQSLTLAYCFHRTGELSVSDIASELAKRQGEGEDAKRKIAAWQASVQEKLGVAGGEAAPAAPEAAAAAAAPAAVAPAVSS